MAPSRDRLPYVDRLIARIGFGVLASIVLSVTALSDSQFDSSTPRDDPYAFARLIVAARTADGVGYEAAVDYERRRGDRVEHRTVRVARTARGSVEWGEDGAVLRRDGREWTCSEVDDTWACAETTGQQSGFRAGNAAMFLAAAASGEYRFETRPSRSTVGGAAPCYGVALTGAAPVAGIGLDVEVCYAPGGPLVFARQIAAASTDTRRVDELEAIDDSTLGERFAEASRGLVALDS